MNLQSAFNVIYSHLLTQKEKAIANGDGGYCCYKDTATGRKCAVGVLITDELYHPGMEGHSIHELAHTYNPDTYGFNPNYHECRHELAEKYLAFCELYDINDEAIQFLSDLQTIHDSNEVVLWPQLLKEFAFRYNLTVPKLGEHYEYTS